MKVYVLINEYKEIAMEKNLKQKVNDYIDEFKQNLQKWMIDNGATVQVDGVSKGNDFLQYMNDFPYLEFQKEDFQKRKRIKNSVPDYNRCIALKCNGERCSRKQKNSSTDFCGTHMKGAPYGTIEQQCTSPKQRKVQLWMEDINGISRYIDKDFNVYSSKDIVNSSENPQVIGQYGIDNETGLYYLVR